MNPGAQQNELTEVYAHNTLSISAPVDVFTLNYVSLSVILHTRLGQGNSCPFEKNISFSTLEMCMKN